MPTVKERLLTHGRIVASFIRTVGIETFGHVRYMDTFWDDVKVTIATAKVGAATWQPTWTKFSDDGAGSRGVYAWLFDPTTPNEAFFDVQFPHGYKHGTDVEPHIHWSPNGTDTGNVRWGLEYVWQNYRGIFGATSLIYVEAAADGSAKKHQIAALPTVAGSGKQISSVILCRLFRDAADAGDTLTDGAFPISVDFHCQIDAPGSSEEYIK